MKQELEQKLMDAFPFMEARNNRTGKKLGFPMSCECEDGWFDLIYEMCNKIQIALNKSSKAFIKGFFPQQIKEKFASLRYYTTYENEEISKAIKEAEEQSIKTCEICGKDGKTKYRRTWYKTLCEECAEKHGYEDFKKTEKGI